MWLRFHVPNRTPRRCPNGTEPGGPCSATYCLFRVKLLVDGLKDLVLSPAALIAVVVGLLRDPAHPGRYFYRLMRMGRDFDRWVDLFGADETKRLSGPSAESRYAGEQPSGLDSVIDRLQQAVVDQQARGGLTEKARQAIDRALDALEPTSKEGDDRRSS